MNKAEPPITKDYLTIVALEDDLTAKLSVNACEYCVDGDGVWKTLPANTETESINSGQTLSFRGNLTPTSSVGIGTFVVNKQFNLKGNCMSLLFGDDTKDCFSLEGKNYAFYTLFAKTKVVDASELQLSAIILPRDCYSYMFSECGNLICPPNLQEPNNAPTSAYAGMFFNCTGLQVAPILLAKSIGWGGYNYMFANCSKLNYIKALFTTTPGDNYTLNWLKGVAPSGVFVKSKDANWDVRGVSGVPEGWTIIKE